MLFYFTPEKIGDLLMLKWEAPTLVEKEMDKHLGKKMFADMDREKGKRTPKQNNSVHKYCQLVADALNDGGFPLKFKLGDKEIELDWDTRLVKENLWRKIQIALLGKGSTTELSKIEDIDKVYEHLNRFFSNEPFMFHIPFPSEESKGTMPEYPTYEKPLI